ncbi:MAG: hypothetical protein OXR66_08380 [Candidatus Woesearchaeota archaeon]|nr:hypothetical protein [Candidatus Woesearchaeota archaeon]
MRNMTWNECVEKGLLVKEQTDSNRAHQMRALATLRLEFWSGQRNKKFTTLKIEAYYEIIKELVFAHMYKHGYNCKNHLCLIAYMRTTFPAFAYEIEKIDELRQIRNEISYRGLTISSDYMQRNEREFKHIITTLTAEV